MEHSSLCTYVFRVPQIPVRVRATGVSLTTGFSQATPTFSRIRVRRAFSMTTLTVNRGLLSSLFFVCADHMVFIADQPWRFSWRTISCTVQSSRASRAALRSRLDTESGALEMDGTMRRTGTSGPSGGGRTSRPSHSSLNGVEYTATLGGGCQKKAILIFPTS